MNFLNTEKGGTVMPSQEGVELSRIVLKKIEELRSVCLKVDERTASSAPQDRWSPKEILSHLCGPEGVGLMPLVRAFLEEDIPRLDMEPAKTYFTGKRSQMTFAELLAEFEHTYGQMADFVAPLPEEQLARKAHVPMFKETPIGEYPTLAMFVRGIADFHIGDHINHLKEILEALKAGPVR
jgi:hypothetical protein